MSLPLDRSAFKLPALKEEDVLQVNESEVLEVLRSMDTNKAVPRSDVSTKILKTFARILISLRYYGYFVLIVASPE